LQEQVGQLITHPRKPFFAHATLDLDGGDGLVEHVAYVELEVFQRRNDLTFLASVTLFLRPLNPGFVPAGVVSGKESAARRNSFYQCGWLPIR
jgi:hypothetical protein